MTMDKLIYKVQKWGRDKGLNKKSNAYKQFTKTIEEVGELAGSLCRHPEELDCDSVGDILVTLILLTDMYDTDVEHCLSVAWGEIKDRTGETRDGVFIKSSDL